MNELDVALTLTLPNGERLVWSRNENDPGHVGFLTDFQSEPTYREAVGEIEGADGAVLGRSFRGARYTVWDFFNATLDPNIRNQQLEAIQKVALYRNQDVTLEWRDSSGFPKRVVGRIQRPFSPKHAGGPEKTGQLQLISAKHYIEQGGDYLVREKTNSGTLDVPVGGNYYAYPEIYVWDCDEISITNNTTGQNITVDYEVSGSSDYIKIDCAPGMANRIPLLNGNPYTTNITGSMTADDPDFFHLFPSAVNELSITPTNPGGSFKVRVRYRASFDN